MLLVTLVTLAMLALSSPAAAQAIGAGAPCGNQAAPCPQEEQAMDRDTTYKGLHIRIVAQRAADGRWRARAEFTEQAGPPVRTTQDSYASEQDAYTAALSAAMAQVDRARERIGKP
jgi:hypothetical protein